MIIKEGQNTIVAAPAITNMTEALAKYKTFSDNAGATMNDFLDFITTPSIMRNHFLADAEEVNTIIGTSYIDRQLTV